MTSMGSRNGWEGRRTAQSVDLVAVDVSIAIKARVGGRAADGIVSVGSAAQVLAGVAADVKAGMVRLAAARAAPAVAKRCIGRACARKKHP